MKRFTKQACRENLVASFFPLKIFIPLCFNVLSTVPRENRLADSLCSVYKDIYIYIYIYIHMYLQMLTYQDIDIVTHPYCGVRSFCGDKIRSPQIKALQTLLYGEKLPLDHKLERSP